MNFEPKISLFFVLVVFVQCISTPICFKSWMWMREATPGQPKCGCSTRIISLVLAGMHQSTVVHLACTSHTTPSGSQTSVCWKNLEAFLVKKK